MRTAKVHQSLCRPMCVSIQSATIIIIESMVLCNFLWKGCWLDIKAMMWFSTNVHRSSKLQFRAVGIDSTLQQLLMTWIAVLSLIPAAMVVLLMLCRLDMEMNFASSAGRTRPIKWIAGIEVYLSLWLRRHRDPQRVHTFAFSVS